MKQLLIAVVLSLVLIPSYAMTDEAGVVSFDLVQLDTLNNFDNTFADVGADTVVVSNLASERPAINSERPCKVSAGLKREKFTEPISYKLTNVEKHSYGAGNTS